MKIRTFNTALSAKQVFNLTNEARKAIEWATNQITTPLSIEGEFEGISWKVIPESKQAIFFDPNNNSPFIAVDFEEEEANEEF